MSLSEALLLEDVRQRLFSPVPSEFPRAIGVELELIPVDANAGTPVPASGTPSTGSILSALAARERWTEERAAGDPPSWHLRDGSRISFEPGGQIEISSAPHATGSSLIDTVQRLAFTIEEEMKAEGVILMARGVDPFNDIERVPLQLHRERYTRMTEYFDSIGPAGIRMMRQTAALQMNVERGADPASRWRLLNAMAPVVVALFASSRRYAGKDTGFTSYRAHLWRTLDPSRTGIPYGAEDPARRYLQFALDAGAIRSGGKGKPYVTFREFMQGAEVGTEDWNFHLSTLFPEVRPKEYFELRSADTIDIAWLPAPIVFVTGLVYDADAAREAARLLGEPSAQLLERAGRRGLLDRQLKELTAELTRLALSGAVSLGTDYLAADHVETAREYFVGALDGT